MRKHYPLSWSLAAFVLGACAPPPAPIEVVETTIAQVQDAITSGQTTCRMVVQSYLDRIEAYDQPTGMNAITVVNPNALARADEIDEAVANRDPLGSLFCAPLLIKDNYDTYDLPTTGGSIALKESIPPDDAFMVQKLREADAIVLAKTNMAEWAFSPRQTVSSSYGTTANAYALDRVPAGSSGGTASGVAASFGVAGMGTDTGNSIRGPSSHLALFGIRSTIGLTSRDGVIPLSFQSDIAGPMARTVEDAARIFNVVAGYDPADPYTEEGRGQRADDYTVFLDAQGLAGARIGVLRELVDTDDADAEVIEVFEQALVDLQRLGAEIVDPLEIAPLRELRSGGGGCSTFRYDMAQYLASLGDEAPIRDVLEVLETGEYSEYVEGRIQRSSNSSLDSPSEWDPPCLPYAENPGRQAYKDAVVAAMDAADVQAIVYPTWTNPPAPLETASEDYRGDNSQIVAPGTGLPAGTVPMGYTRTTLPAGLQILARPYQEGVIFRLAYAYEQGTAHRRPPDGFPTLLLPPG